MAKRKKAKGRSARHGRRPSPYQKYEKTPYKYSSAYYEWFRGAHAKNQRSKSDQHQRVA